MLPVLALPSQQVQELLWEKLGAALEQLQRRWVNPKQWLTRPWDALSLAPLRSHAANWQLGAIRAWGLQR